MTQEPTEQSDAKALLAYLASLSPWEREEAIEYINQVASPTVGPKEQLALLLAKSRP